MNALALSPASSGRRRLSVALAGGIWLLARACPLWAEPPRGEQLFADKCAACHGARGEGSDEYPHPLVGDKSPGELVRFIAENMPKDDPGQCVGEDAQAVATYVHDGFYSPIAQARNRPPRVELSRLTVRQYRNVVADLVGSFRSGERPTDQRGLRGEYFNARRFRDDRRVLDRIDERVEFDFGESSPAPDQLDPHAFSIRWTGALLAAETGEHELIVRTDHAARLFVNDRERPLIDAWVKSGNDTEFRSSIYLLGGRAYPLTLEFSKAKQGVDDSKDKQTLPPAGPAFVALWWQRPHLPAEPIPQRSLLPQTLPEIFAVSAPFPPDDRSMGYERGTSVSKAWDQAATAAAVETAGYVAAHLRELSGAADDAADRPARLREFCRRFAERAFRRPLSAEEQAALVERRFAAAPDAQTAVKHVVLLVLKSPAFLYHESPAEPPGFRVATRLSLGMWDSLPDEQLWDAAASGQLATREQVAAQAERMLHDPRAAAKLRQFLLELLKVDHVPQIAKDSTLFADFSPQVAADLRTSLELFLTEWMAADRPDFRRLLLADEVYLNGRLAKFYGLPLPEDAPFAPLKLEPGERAGVLTHPYLLARFAYNATSSPIHRGLFVARSLLGRVLRPPPEAVAPLAPDLHPSLTTRERVALQTSATTCQMCHKLINPLGFTLEHFDAVGRFRQQEQGQPIDALGSYETRSGQAVPLAGARALAQFLAGSEEAHAAFVEHLFHHFVKQPIFAYGPDTSGRLRAALAASDFDVHRLLMETMVVAALAPHEPAAP